MNRTAYIVCEHIAGKTYAQLAEELGLSVPRVQQIGARGERTIGMAPSRGALAWLSEAAIRFRGLEQREILPDSPVAFFYELMRESALDVIKKGT